MSIAETTIRLAHSVPGCNPCGCNACIISIFPAGCPSYGVPCALVTLSRDGITVASGRVPKDGPYVVDFSGLDGDDYDLTISADRFLPYTGTVNCESDGPLHSVQLEIDPDFVCACDEGFPPPGYPLPRSIDGPAGPLVWSGSNLLEFDAGSETVPGWSNGTGANRRVLTCVEIIADQDGRPVLYRHFDPPDPLLGIGAAVAAESHTFLPFLANFAEAGVYTEPSSPFPGPSASVCITATRPGCGSAGDPISGATVEVIAGAISPVTPCTTDASGLCCLTVGNRGTIRVRVTDPDGCEVEATLYLDGCEETFSATVEVCCSRICLVLTEEGTDPLQAIVGATVNWGSGLGTSITDSEGLACRTLTTAEMLALPQGGTCNDRVLPDVHVTRNATETDPALLERCVSLTVSCTEDQEASPQPVSAAYIPLGYQRCGCCPDVGCGSIIIDRGLTPEDPDTILEIVRKDVGGNVVDTFRYEGNPTLDLADCDELGVTNYESNCIDSTSGLVLAPNYEDIGGPTPYLSARVRIEACREGDVPARVRVRCFREASCSGFVDWDTAANPDDLEFDFVLSAEKRICYGEDLFETGTIPSDNDTYEISMIGP